MLHSSSNAFAFAQSLGLRLATGECVVPLCGAPISDQLGPEHYEPTWQRLPHQIACCACRRRSRVYWTLAP